jgi:hypothetical protein
MSFVLHVMGDGAPKDWIQELDDRPEDGQTIEHDGKSYFVIKGMPANSDESVITLIPKIYGAVVQSTEGSPVLDPGRRFGGIETS